MKRTISIAVASLLLFGQAQAAERREAETDVTDRKQKLSYSLGYDAAERIRRSGVDIDPRVYTKAFNDAFAGEKSPLAPEEMRAAIQSLQRELKEKRSVNGKGPGGKRESAEKNRLEGEAFLAENARKDGVVTLPSGLQYRKIGEGAGRQPSMNDKVTIHYRGMRVGGSEFHNSYKSGKPVVNDMGKFIKGLTEGLQLMKEGSRWMLYVPPDLAYGARGLGRGKAKIGPNQTLIFEVELVAVHPQEPKKGAARERGGAEERK